jgi:outer membrane lipoprotein-sorting protein
MNGKFKKITAAVIILIAVILGIFGLQLDGSSVAWAEVAERIALVKNMSYRIHTTIEGSLTGETSDDEVTNMEMLICISDEYGMKMENSIKALNETEDEFSIVHVMYMDPAANSMLTVMHSEKLYMTIELDENTLKEMKDQSNDPREFVKAFMESEYVELGRSEIDGIVVEGIESTEPPTAAGDAFKNSVSTVWVDVENGWPVLIEMDFDMIIGENTCKMHMAMKNFEWNIDLDPAEFTPVIPDDYTEMASVKMPAMDAQATIQGLRTFSKKTGRYPKSLNLVEMTQEMTKAVTDKITSEKDTDSLADDDDMMQDMMTMMASGQFYILLEAEDKEPAYYGEFVTPEDVDLPLLRWKNPDGTFQVIFGDLTIETVSAEDLALLEAPLLELIEQ